MNKLLIVLLLAFVAVVFANSAFDTDAKAKFFDFIVKYDKEYKSGDEAFMRYRIFKENLKRIAKMNLQDEKAEFGITKFADLTPSEFSHLYLMPKRPHPVIEDEDVLDFKPTLTSLPASWDWRTDGKVDGVSAITAVYNQGQCGSCWAFSATEQIESMNFLDKTAEDGDKPWHLSMQQIVDCCTQAYGCQGGWTYVAYKYVQGAGGLESGKEYPYTAENGQCDFVKSEVDADISSWKYVTQSQDEGVMKQYIAESGPISICVDAQSWQFYQGGVLSNCGQSIDHCVQLVGYSTMDGEEAWHVRNSWGTDWGVDGYIFLAYGQNTCAMADVPTTVHGLAA